MNAKEVRKNYKKDSKSLRCTYKKDKADVKNEYKEKLSLLTEEYEKDFGIARKSEGKRIPINPPKRHVLEEIGNAVSHGIGSLFSVIALIFMLIHAENATERVGAWFYFSGLFIMFTMSCLYHAFKHGLTVKRVFRRFDYSCIYLLIGATFAPILLSYVGGTFGIVFFIVQWVVIITGITLIGVFGPTRLKFIHMPLYLLLGWCGIVFLPRMLGGDPHFAFYILGGGIIYSLGIIPFAMKTKVAHFIWHFFVLAGAVVQWVGVYLYIYLK